MSVIRVRGIDGNEDTRVMLVEGKTPACLARELYEDRWKFAVLDRGGREVGGIGLDVHLLRRAWWGEPE